MELLIDLLLSLIVTAAFGVLQQLPSRTLLPAGILGVVGRLIYLGVNAQGQSPVMGSFLGAVAIAVLAEALARWQKMPVIVYVVASFIPLVPGLTIYESMRVLLQGEYSRGIALATQAGLIAVAIAAGLAIVSSVARFYKSRAAQVRR
ncbi:threonine/serine exporter family protein [Heliobacterium gestii]|uniref:Threonine/serine exporter family protein n=1 Tax=Heliomicrobium gestii TaxID=2699 RepID=A0A845L944_HELGE|nr:threonine/serine exporter family protein [Heliomicrobium gestii]MBM7865181.1 uncharacterized membrane protein YjjB (DUF3815 family) [Heliomicrobium gestii]MZP41450.1 threonine/serine exporter family protein [Heliomicrobium gestii]